MFKNNTKIITLIFILTIFIMFAVLSQTVFSQEKIVRPVKNTEAMILPSPKPISPKPGAVFNFYPRHLELKWLPVKGAERYMVEVEYNDSKWEAYKLESTGKETHFIFDFVGAQPGRWRVWAIDANNKEGRKSSWWGFKFTK